MGRLQARVIRIDRQLRTGNRFISTGFNATVIGTATGVVGTGSLGLNDYIINSLSAIALGQGVNNRNGNSLKFLTMQVRLYCSLPVGSRVRMVIAKTVDAGLSGLTTNGALTSFVEGNYLADSPLGGSIVGKIDSVADKGDETILLDRTWCNDTGAATAILPMTFDMPLNLLRRYQDSTPFAADRGGFYLYMVSSVASTTLVSGYVKVLYTDLAGGQVAQS